MATMEFLADLGLAVLLSALEALALVGFWFAEGMRQWAARGQSVPDPTGWYLVLLSMGSACSAMIAYGLAWADLHMACTAQAVMASLLSLLLLLVAVTACGKRLRRDRRRRRLRRERLRWHESQREGSTPASASVRRCRLRL
jgi:heme exporter protein D